MGVPAMLSPLPVFIQWLQALAVPVIAGVGVWIALQQMHMAKVKLQHDLFDRRFKIFDAARKFLLDIITHGRPTRENINEYVRGTADAIFLLNKETDEYLIELRKKALASTMIRVQYERLPVGPQRAALVEKEGKHFLWLNNQLEVLFDKFEPFLQLQKTSPMKRAINWMQERFAAAREWVHKS